MQTNIHPKWYNDTKVTCACGNTFITSSTQKEITVDVCSNCHPFYTGKMTLIDTAGRVDAFKSKLKAKKARSSKTEKRKARREKKLKEQASRPTSLEELRTKKVKK